MILLTGAAGIVGRAAALQLRRQGIPFVGAVRSRYSGAGEYVACDLSAEPLADRVAVAPAAIIHTAAAVPHSIRYPDNPKTADLTRRMDENVLQAAKRWQCPVVYVSTCGLYDRRSPGVKHEDDELPALPSSPYFAAKRDGEKLFLQLPHGTVLRISAPLGPGVPRHLVASRFILEAMHGGTMQVFGTGSREQNYVAAEDIAAALLKAAAFPWQGVINIAASNPVKMLELAQRISTVIGGRVEIADTQDPREGETARYSIERAATVLDWAPASTLDEMIATVAKNFRTTDTESIA